MSSLPQTFGSIVITLQKNSLPWWYMFVTVGHFFCHACTSMTNLWQNQDSHTCDVVEVFHDITKIIIMEVDTSVMIILVMSWNTSTTAHVWLSWFCHKFVMDVHAWQKTWPTVTNMYHHRSVFFCSEEGGSLPLSPGGTCRRGKDRDSNLHQQPCYRQH